MYCVEAPETSTYPGEPVVVEGSSRGMSEGLHNEAQGQ